ncbi:lumenal Hsp70 protein [Thelotrema lepadinum]|nr:lumenal Hsp70 protein [Thelotrema lepadinum]
MAPPGRRRLSAFTLFVAFAYFFASVSAVSSVLGIDLGTEYIKAALVKPGIPLEIVLTKDSRRKEAAAVAFKPVSSKSDSSQEIFPERLYGADALALAARFPGDVYPNIKPLLGLKGQESPPVAQFSRRYPGLQIAPCKSGSVCLKSDTFVTKEESFTVEELLAMQLQNIRANAEAFAGKGNVIKDAVFTVPVFYTAHEKRAVETAAELAGINILAMTTDGLAVGINYATSRTFPVANEGGKPEYHLVYDMGAGSTTATVMKFQGKSVKDVGRFNKTIQEVNVLGAGWDRSLGGDTLNALILEDMVSKLAQSKQITALGVTTSDIVAHGRTVAKMWKEAERMRQVLSANTETQASFEGLYHEDVNFRYKLTRANFESMTAAFGDRVTYPVLQALEMAKLGIEDIDSIILHGGAVRTPLVQKALEAIVGKGDRLRTNVNSDEAAAFGAAFKAAGISPSFRVKEIRTSEAGIMPVTLSWVSDGKERQQKLFVPTSAAGSEKQIPLRFLDDFSFSLSQQVSDGVDSIRAVPLTRVQSKNLTDSVKELTNKYGCEPADITTQFKIRLSPVDALPEVTHGSVSCEVLDKKGVVDNVKGYFGFGSKKEGSESSETETEAAEADMDPPGTAPSQDAKATDAEKKEKKDKAEPPETKKVTIYVGFTKDVLSTSSASETELKSIKDRMKAFDTSDKNRKRREEALNTLEGYTYRVRDMFDNQDFVAVSTAKQRSELESKNMATSEWLYGDGANARTSEFKKRLKELEDLVDPIQARRKEAHERPELIDKLRKSIEQTRGLVSAIKDTVEQASSAAAISSSSAESAASEAAASPTPVVDELDELDDQPVASPSPSTAPIPEAPFWSAEELAPLTAIYEAAEKWLEEKLAAQEKLLPYEDSVLTAKDLTAKAEEVEKIMQDALWKRMNANKKAKSSSSKSKSKAKSKSKSAAKTSSTTVPTDSPAPEPPVEEVRDEL